MERTLFQFVWTHSWRNQLLVVFASSVSFPLILMSLYVPKLIVNDALRSNDFPQGILGFELEQLQYLVALCLMLLLLIFLNNGVKYFINISKGLNGERILRRLRYTVYRRIIRLPLPRLKQTSPGEVVQVMVAEMEPIGGFAGEIIATPVYQGGQLLVYMGFIIAQDPILGLAAIVLFPVQAYVVPKVQRIVIRLVQARIRNVRGMSADISESIVGIEDMHLAGAGRWHLARVSERLYTNFRIRYRIFLLKYAIKFANNVINNITPFFFYSFGGYLVIEGRMDLGALVAILAAYKDIASPWRALLNYYQTLADISTRYEAIVETYGSEPLPAEEPILRLQGHSIVMKDVHSSLALGSGGVENVNLELEPGRSYAVLGEEENGRGELMKLISGLSLPAAGHFHVGEEQGRSLMTRAARDIGYVSRNPHIMNGSLRENVSYGMLASQGRGDPPEDWARREREALITGAIPDSPNMDWVDYGRLGLESSTEFDDHAIDLMCRIGMQQDLFARGLSTVIDPTAEPELAAAALKARETLKEAESEVQLEGFVESWQADAFLENASLSENLFFGLPDSVRRHGKLADDSLALKALERADIAREVVEIGLETAEALQELLSSLGQDTALLDQIGLVEPAEREEYATIVIKARRRGVRWLGRADRLQLVRVALQLVPLRHRLGVLEAPERREKLLTARSAIRKYYAPASGFTRFDAGGYVPGLPLIENILDGRPRLDRRDVAPSIESRLEKTMIEYNIQGFVMRAGLRTDLGYGGGNLSSSLKRRLALVRGLVSRPSLLVLDGVLDDDDDEQRELRRMIREMLPQTIIAYGSNNHRLSPEVDVTLRVIGGQISAAGAGEARRRDAGDEGREAER